MRRLIEPHCGTHQICYALHSQKQLFHELHNVYGYFLWWRFKSQNYRKIIVGGIFYFEHALLYKGTIKERRKCNPPTPNNLTIYTIRLSPSNYSTCFISKLWNGSEVITPQLSYSEQAHRSFQKLREAPEQAECKTICFSNTLRVLAGDSQCFWSSGIEYKNIVKSIKSSLECDNIQALSG